MGLVEKKQHVMELSKTKQDGEGQPVARRKEEALKNSTEELDEKEHLKRRNQRTRTTGAVDGTTI